MKESIINSNKSFGDDSIDLIALFKNIWAERNLIRKAVILFFVIGCLVAILSPIEYTSQTTFVPQVSGDDMTSSIDNRFGSLASLAGIDLSPNEMTTDSYLSPLVYTNVIDSEEFSLKLLKAQLINSDAEKLTVKEYLLANQSIFNFNPIGFIKKYTIGLILNSESKEIRSDILKNYNFIDDVDYDLLHTFREKFKIELNDKEGYIKVFASDKDPFISSQIVEIVTKSLQSKIIEIRTNKIRERLEFSREQYELKQIEFDFLQKKLAEFKDSNKSISTASFRSELQKLESEYQLQQNILVNLASEYNNNKIKLNKDTPIFSVIDEVSVPNERSKPKRTILVILYVFTGLILSIIYTLAKNPLISIIEEIKD